MCVIAALIGSHGCAIKQACPQLPKPPNRGSKFVGASVTPKGTFAFAVTPDAIYESSASHVTARHRLANYVWRDRKSEGSIWRDGRSFIPSTKLSLRRAAKMTHLT